MHLSADALEVAGVGQDDPIPCTRLRRATWASASSRDGRTARSSSRSWPVDQPAADLLDEVAWWQPWRQSVPIANENRLVVPDALATTIKSAKLGCPGGARSPGVDGIRPAGRCWSPIYPAGRCWSPIYRACRRDVPRDPLRPSNISGQRTDSFWLQQVGAGSLATHCERGRGPITLAGAPSAEYSRLSRPTEKLWTCARSSGSARHGRPL
jgi:hypothetical protein